MKKGDFISVAKRMVKEHYNRYVAGNDDMKIDTSDIHVIQFEDIDDDYRIVLTTAYVDGMYYEVTYDHETDELDSMILKERF